MYLFNRLGLEAFHGAIFSTFLGLSTSIIIPFIYLKKKLNFNYKETIKILPRSIINIAIVIIIDLALSLILPINSTSRIIQILNICIIGIITGLVYLILSRDNLKEILPEKINKILQNLKIYN